MTERWERELGKLAKIQPPTGLRRRFHEGPRGEGVPPTPARQRLAAGLVGLAVFGFAGLLMMSVFRDGLSPSAIDPDAAVLTLTAGIKPEASLTFGGDAAEVVTAAYCWDQPNGAQACADPISPEPFAPSAFLEVPAGTRFQLVNDDGADPVALSLATGDDASVVGTPTTVERLQGAAPGYYVLTVAASWDQSPAPIVFSFPIEIVPDAPPSEVPEPGVAVVTVETEPLRVTLTYDGTVQRGMIEDTWKPGREPRQGADPPCDFSTIGDRLLIVPGSTELRVEGELESFTLPGDVADQVRLPEGRGPVLWAFRGETAGVGFDACFPLFLGDAGATVPVPDLTDRPEQGAYGDLGDVGLLWDVVFEHAPDERQWRVLRTEPPAGAELAPNSVVHLVVSTRIVPPSDIGEVEWACAPQDRVAFGGPHLRLGIGGDAYVTGNLGGARRGDELTLAVLVNGPYGDIWHWVRDGEVIAVVYYDSLDGVACRGSGVAGV